jgi:hypothetical protein
MTKIQAIIFAGLFLIVFGQDADAQPTLASARTRSITAIRLATGESVDLDGQLDESVWSRALPAADFRQIDPTNGAPATEATEVRIAYDDEALYMGVTCYDSEPDRWLGYQRRRDEFLPADDRFMWTIDTFLDTRSGYFFEMNPSGLMADSLFGVNGDNRAWDGIWNARVRHSAIGWTIEIQIPFRTLNFNPDVDAWGANFQRTVRRKNEDSIWTGWARNQGLRRMTNAGRISGICGTSRGGLDVKPYGLVSAQRSPGRENAGLEGNRAAAGVDLFYNPTPLLRANLTVNTDFAQTEVDQRQVNLTRFSLFFPERRDYRRYRPSLAFQPRPNGHRYIRRFVFNGSVDTQTNLENALLTREIEFTLLETQFHSQDSFGITLNSTEEHLDEPFAITRDITLPAGNRYNFTRFRVRGQTANRRVLALTGRVEAGSFYSGTRRQAVLNWTVRMRPGYIVYLNSEWNTVRLAEGEFSSNVFRIVGETQFTPWVALVNNLQYDTVSRVAGWQSRFRWIVRPGNDLYLVYTHNWLDDLALNRFATLDRRFASKVMYTHRF